MQLHYSYKRPLASASSLGGELSSSSSSSLSKSSSYSISSSGHSGYSIFLITMCLVAFYAVYGWGPFADLERKVLIMMFILILIKYEIRTKPQTNATKYLSEGERERSRLGHFKRFETSNQGESQLLNVSSFKLWPVAESELKFSENEGEIKMPSLKMKVKHRRLRKYHAGDQEKLQVKDNIFVFYKRNSKGGGGLGRGRSRTQILAGRPKL